MGKPQSKPPALKLSQVLNGDIVSIACTEEMTSPWCLNSTYLGGSFCLPVHTVLSVSFGGPIIHKATQTGSSQTINPSPSSS